MINVLYDHQIFRERFGGISKYHYELLTQISQVDNSIKITLTELISENHYLNADGALTKNKFQDLAMRVNFKGKGALIEKYNKFKALKEIGNNRFDILHPTYYDPYFLKRIKRPFVITVHDFVHEKFYPHKIDIVNKGILIKKAAKIIAISHSTKNDLLQLYPDIIETKIEVVHHGYDLSNLTHVNNICKSITPKYILFVGKRYGYKNFSLFLKAASKLIKEDDDLLLYCTGSVFSKKELYEIENLGISDKVIAVPATNEELNKLYANALAFVFPSLNEGFGLPILEAFANGCPIALSDIPCFKEIAADAAIYFDPDDVASIYYAIKALIYNDNIIATQQALGFKRLMKFNIKQTLKNTINVYKMVV